VRDRNVAGVGGDGGCRRRRDVADHDQQLEPQLRQQVGEARHDLSELLPARSRPDSEMVIGVGQAEGAEEGLGKERIVVLPGVDELAPHATPGKRAEHRGGLDEVRPGAGDEAQPPVCARAHVPIPAVHTRCAPRPRGDNPTRTAASTPGHLSGRAG